MIYLLSQLVDRSADRRADGEAFVAPEGRLTYGELAAGSNRLAHLLRDEGVRRGDRVGIFMPRTLETAVGVYGILKAGAAYVPIDPQMPAGGLARLVADCGIEHLISDRNQLPVLERLADRASGLRSVVGLEADLGRSIRVRPWTECEGFGGGSPPDLRTMEEDLAYIMYSSGSTGRPKGIMHTHRSGLAYAELSVATYGVTAEDRIGNHSPLHFDMSTFGYFSAPLAGAATLLVPEAYTKVTASLSQLMESERLTIWYSVPLALIQLLMRGALESRDLTSLRWVLFGGEPFQRQHLDALRARWPQAWFSNVYGPAEVNQCTFYHLPPLGDDASTGGDDEPVPIGKVWENSEGLVVDDEDRPVADGAAGELVVHSPTMMRGYWGRPDLDAGAFFRQRERSGTEKVFYRTGDLVRRRDDGELLFLGRKDRQVKVRGYRIELDEIERTLAAHPAVEEAAVFPVRVGGEVEHLEAAVTLKAAADSPAEEGVGPQTLRTYLADIVSWYSVPARVEVAADLPRTGSDKIDRRQLQIAAEARAGER